MSWQERIVMNPDVLVGKPLVKGTRLAVEFIVGLLAQGRSQEEVLLQGKLGLGPSYLITNVVLNLTMDFKKRCT